LQDSSFLAVLNNSPSRDKKGLKMGSFHLIADQCCEIVTGNT